MKKKYLIFIMTLILTATLALLLSGCGGEDALFEGKYIVTFELNGGTLDYKTSSVNTQIKYAYEPETYVLDVAEMDGYDFYKNGYVFTGWYTKDTCLPEDKWDFENSVITTEELTLYAGWERAIVYSYTLYYVDGENDVKLDSYKVKAGDSFKDLFNYAQKRDGYTPIGYFSDRAFLTPWDNATVHPGGETDTDIPVYVNYIEGEWNLVSDVNSLKSAVKSDKDIYLLCDIDCKGAELSFSSSYTGVFEGNGYKISNFTIFKSALTRKPACAIFSELGDGAVIRNVAFEGVTYNMTGIKTDLVTEVKFAPLAVTAGSISVNNVTVSGTVKTNYTGELSRINSVYYELAKDDATVTSDGFTATITVTVESESGASNS